MRYIGSKSNLLQNISAVLDTHLFGTEETFVDLFAGTNVVANHFKDRFKIISNDMLYFSYVNAKATIENNGNLAFEKLTQIGIDSPIAYLQEQAEVYALSGAVGYYEKNYSPTGGAQYVSVANAKRIDYVRDQLDLWLSEGAITEVEFYYLLSSLIEGITRVSNTTGTYGAFLKHWDRRALNTLELIPDEVKDNHKKNICFNTDSNRLVRELEADIMYIDTPYNSRQYASNYHLLENVALNNKPKLKGKTRIFDWAPMKSDYSTKTKALSAMKDLLESIKATHVLLSYSNEGLISEEELTSLLRSQALDGTLEVIRIPYRKYKSKIPSNEDSLYEMLFYFQKSWAERTKVRSAQSKSVASQSKRNTLTWSCDRASYIKSPLNYIGGKYRLLKQIIPLLPKDVDLFVDLFSGGANVGINAMGNRHIFNDMNSKMNDIFRYFMAKDPQLIVREIRDLIAEWNLSKTNESAYLAFRNYYNQNPSPIGLYTLTCFSYNYQFRFNNSQEYNNPFGRNRSHFSLNMEKNLIRFIEKLNEMNAEFTDLYFDEFDFNKLTNRDFVYLDPPYLITTGSYNDGNRGFKNWNRAQEEQMYELLSTLSKKGIRYALSNVIEHKGKINELLKEYIANHHLHVHYLNYNYDNASHNSKKRGSTEILLTNY